MNNRVIHYIKSVSSGLVSKGDDGVVGEGQGERRHWTNTVFLQVSDPELEMALEELMNQSGCYSHCGDPGSPDIIAVPSFAVVVDRKVLGREQWQSYLQYREEVNSMDLCIVVDDIQDWEFSEEDPNIERAKFNVPEDARQIFELIKNHRWVYLNR